MGKCKEVERNELCNPMHIPVCSEGSPMDSHAMSGALERKGCMSSGMSLMVRRRSHFHGALRLLQNIAHCPPFGNTTVSQNASGGAMPLSLALPRGNWLTSVGNKIQDETHLQQGLLYILNPAWT